MDDTFLHQFLLSAHNLTRWAVVGGGVAALVVPALALRNQRAWGKQDDQIYAFFMWAITVQFLIGLALYVVGPIGLSSFVKGMADVMRSSVLRFFVVEHITLMTIVAALVHGGRAMIRKAKNDQGKHKRAAILSGVSLLLVLASIPWPFYENFGRPLFRLFGIVF